jgi:mono/diheme cytochrome c family protein
VRFAFLLFAPVVYSQSLVEHGADVFAKTCATGYCHGTRGAGGGAPKLAGRGFDESSIISVTRAGVAGTAMQGYGTILARPDFNAVVAYIASLNGIEPKAADIAVLALSLEAERGRDLFSDPLRGFERCSTCHQVNGVGIPVAAVVNIPADLKNISTPHVRMVSAEGDRFPALVVSEGGRRTSLYDLSVLPPVLRTLDSGALKINGPASWRHAAGSYRDDELRAIAAFLRAAR